MVTELAHRKLQVQNSNLSSILPMCLC
uniref:Uncharacterized protein n=1 Tax=Ciona intestinalis TaxID=7719 RepID=H2Y075_CIOIN